MLIVAGEIKIAPDDIEKARALAAAMVTETLKEPGCQAYSFAVDLLEPGTVRLFERWDDQAALDAHFQTPHMAAFNAGLAEITILGASVKIYDVSGVRDLM